MSKPFNNTLTPRETKTKTNAMYLVHDWIGLIHLAAAIVALITGTAVLAMRKGTETHRKVGFVYAGAMVMVVVTAFMIYRLFGGWGIFHWAALVSGLTLLGGMVPVLLRKPDDWVILHFSFMYWSVMGLYMAFVSEMMTRIPEAPPFQMLGLVMGVIGFAAGAFFYYRKSHWEKQFKVGG